MLLSGGRALRQSRRKHLRMGPTWSCTKANTAKHPCGGGPNRGRRRSASLLPLRRSYCGNLRIPRVKLSVRDVFWLVGYPSMASRYCARIHWQMGWAGGIQARSMRRRPMQAWVSCSRGRTTACDPHALGGVPCGQQCGHDIKRSGTKKGICTTLLMRDTVSSLDPHAFIFGSGERRPRSVRGFQDLERVSCVFSSQFSPEGFFTFHARAFTLVPSSHDLHLEQCRWSRGDRRSHRPQTVDQGAATDTVLAHSWMERWKDEARREVARHTRGQKVQERTTHPQVPTSPSFATLPRHIWTAQGGVRYQTMASGATVDGVRSARCVVQCSAHDECESLGLTGSVSHPWLATRGL